MDWITTSGKTLHEAKSNALDQLGIVADEAEFDVINDVEKGFLGRVKTDAKIRARVRPKQPAAKEDRGNRRRSGGGNNRNRGGRGRGKGGNGGDNGSQNKNNGGNNRSGGNKGQNQQRSDSNQNGNQRNKSGDNGNNRNRNRDGGGKNQGGRSAAAAMATPNPEKKKKEAVEHTISREYQERTAQEFLEGVLGAFAMTGAVDVVDEPADDGAIEMTVTGDELGLLVGQKGMTLNALQELTRTVVQRQADGAKTDRLRVDVAGYRARRTAALQDFTRKIAADVAESGNEKLLEPMGPADRKVVHDTVNDMDGVETGSEGEEPRRRVVIRPT